MISKEQLKHIDADALLQHIELLEHVTQVEQIILKAYAEGLDKITVIFKHKFSDVILEELDEGKYSYKDERISELDDGLDFYEVTIK